MSEDLMIEELSEPRADTFKPFAHPYYQRLKGFMAARTNHAHASFPAGTFAPGQLPKAYKFPSNVGTPKVAVKFGVGSLGGNIPKSDVAKFCQDSGYPMPNMKVLSIAGADTTNDPGGANVENNLDWQCILQGWHYAYPTVPCDITILIGPNTAHGIADATTALVKAGCTVINWSWGAGKSQWSAESLTYTEAAFAAAVAAGCFIGAASGDNSVFDGTGARTVDYPCASAHVWAVGGTSTSINSAGDFVGDKAWGDGKPGDEGGGGGFATDTPIPAYQQEVVSGSFRGVPDSSANADPKTGYQTYSDGAWGIVGGTSASSPLTCGLAGVILAMGGNVKDFQIKLYAARKTCFADCVVGSNGDAATAGWDSATGLGTPIGSGIMVTLGIGTPVVPPPPPPVGTTYGTFTAIKAIPAGTVVHLTS